MSSHIPFGQWSQPKPWLLSLLEAAGVPQSFFVFHDVDVFEGCRPNVFHNVLPFGLVGRVFMTRFRVCASGRVSLRWCGALLRAFTQETGRPSASFPNMLASSTWLSTWLFLLRVQCCVGFYWQLWQRPFWSPGANPLNAVLHTALCQDQLLLILQISAWRSLLPGGHPRSLVQSPS